MRKLNNRIKLDRAVGAAENISTGEKTMSNSSKKTPWFLRLAPGVLNLKEMAATAGIGALYGLLFAGILLAPLLPHLAAQSNSPTNNAPTNSVHRDVFYNNPEFRDANSREDCDRILQKVLKDIDKEWEAIETAAEAAYNCNREYNEQLKTNDLQHKRALAQAATTANNILWDCMGLGVAAGGTASGGWVIRSIKRATVTVGRLGSLAGFTLVVGIGTFIVCKELRDDTAQDEVDAANNLKKHADELALRKRDRCRETTNYERVTRRYRLWKGSGGSGGPRRPSNYRRGNYENLKSRARADYYKCLNLFPSGDCGVNE